MRLMAGRFNALAESPVAMLTREFEYEYVAVRWQFVTGMMFFVFAQALRVYRELSASPYLAKAGFFFLVSIAMQMLAFFNAQLVFYGGYFSLFSRFIQLSLKRVVNTYTGAFQIMPFFAIVTFVIAITYAVLALIDVDKDGQLTVEDLKILAKSIPFLKRFIKEEGTPE